MAAKTTNVTILFADISGSTRLYELLGDAPARAKVASCLKLLTDVTERYGGTVIKTIGDEIMCTYPDAETAVNAACEMHEILMDDITETVSGLISLAIRVGLHHGPAILEAGDVYGDAVNVAARLVWRRDLRDRPCLAFRSPRPRPPVFVISNLSLMFLSFSFFS